MTTLALFPHELATNSVKHGALGADSGSVTVHLTDNPGALGLAWVETGGPQISTLPDRRGVGSEMVDRIVPREGLVAELHLPNSAQV